jgi:hypothetical protein
MMSLEEFTLVILSRQSANHFGGLSTNMKGEYGS